MTDTDAQPQPAPRNLTVAEALDLEQATGQTTIEVFAGLRTGNPTVRGALAVVWIVLRRDEPDLTLDDVMDTFDDVGSLLAEALSLVDGDPAGGG